MKKRARTYEIPSKNYGRILLLLDDLHDACTKVEKGNTRHCQKIRSILAQLAELLVSASIEQVDEKRWRKKYGIE